jgi:hypothetical protein
MSKQDHKNGGHINQISVFIVVINCTVGLFVYFFLARSLLLLMGIISETLLAFVPIYLNRRGYTRRAAVVLYFILAAASFFFCCMIGNTKIADLMGGVLVASGGLFFSDRKNRTWSYLIAILVVWGVQENHVIGLIPEIKLGQLNYSRLLLTASIVVVFLVFITSVWLYRRTIEGIENAPENKFLAIALNHVRQLLGPFSITNRNKHKPLKWNDNGLQADLLDPSIMVENGPISIRSMFKEIEDEYRPLARAKGVNVVCNASVGFPEIIQSDERILRAIIVRLVKNAIQSSPRYTTVRVGAYAAGLQLNIGVEDHGLESAPSMKARLFDPSSGLFITRKLVLKLGGTFEVVDKGMDGAMYIVSWLPPKTS